MSSGKRLGMLLNILQCTGLTRKNDLAPDVNSAIGSRNPAQEDISEAYFGKHPIMGAAVIQTSPQDFRES